MAIKIEYDKICIGAFTLCEDANGIVFDGTACANEFESTIGPDQGVSFGYESGGAPPSPTQGALTTIDRYPFAADAPATDVGELAVCRNDQAGNSSSVSGYNSGGRETNYPPYGQDTNRIDKFPFASEDTCTDVGNLIQDRRNVSGHPSGTFGYSSGGVTPNVGIFAHTIDKFPFAADTNASDVGELIFCLTVAGQASSENGYATGGWCEVPRQSRDFIQKFPFASDTSATDIGELTQSRSFSGANNSKICGYNSGGVIWPGPNSVPVDTMDKFPFASDASATDVAEIAVDSSEGTTNSTVSGYITSGRTDGIAKFPFAADAAATDIGELSQARVGGTGQQV